ncbi:hypothetical protein QQG91_06950 [Marivivens sp. LCG002]|uniref:hypothetical protein n=1 Tax=Marivivens sp. LCG002 TaxID=3051171 RepID=UPI0025529747|nr:hypothetical protein [Marivivens sp. LCG002]WIV52171.1 hypothetical protein QQG91_06950 [Marivivens sp. LCG002]
MLWKLFKALFILAILAGLGLVAYAYVGPLFFPNDFAAPTTEIVQPVTLNAQ